jgi:hypothetical protein
MKAGDVELREKPGATVLGCCVGEESGELLASEERSDALEIDTYCGQQVRLVRRERQQQDNSRRSQSADRGRTPYRPQGQKIGWSRTLFGKRRWQQPRGPSCSCYGDQIGTGAELVETWRDEELCDFGRRGGCATWERGALGERCRCSMQTLCDFWRKSRCCDSGIGAGINQVGDKNTVKK